MTPRRPPRPRPGLLLLLALLLPRPTAAVLPTLDRELAVVDRDTIRVSDLRIELDRMQAQRKGDAPLVLPPPEDVLKRLVQNTLLEQEGRRLGLDRSEAVRRQVADAVARQGMTTLLDSVAQSVPGQLPEVLEARQAAVRDYIERLKRRFNVKVDTALLASLDYGATDSLVQRSLSEREDVIATVPDGKLTVKGLTREIRFTYFHGLQGRPETAGIRDKLCDEWVVERVLSRQARLEGFATRPATLRFARLLERDLVREETLNTLLGFSFKPEPKEVEAFYRAHLAQFTPAARIKVDSALLKDEASARAFHDRLRQGAKFRWLVGRTAEVQPGIRPFPAEWVEPQALGLKPGEAAAGQVLEPYEVPGGWAVAVVSEVEPVAPSSLADSRDRVLGLMKTQRTREVLAEALRRLEAATPTRILPDARALVAGELARLAAKGDKS
ncbi:MAG: peptidylprolyl isomerase [Candidatus Krumholzibacteriia bacterium]